MTDGFTFSSVVTLLCAGALLGVAFFWFSRRMFRRLWIIGLVGKLTDDIQPDPDEEGSVQLGDTQVDLRRKVEAVDFDAAVAKYDYQKRQTGELPAFDAQSLPIDTDPPPAPPGNIDQKQPPSQRDEQKRQARSSQNDEKGDEQ